MKPILIHEVHDMWPATLVELGGMSKKHPFVKLLQIAENSAYKNSDKIVSILPNTEDYMIEHGLDKGKFEYISNGVVKEEWENAIDIPDEMAKELTAIRRKGNYILGYYGGHALSNALDSLIDVAKSLHDEKDIKIILVGKGVEKERLIKRCKEEKINNVIFYDAIDKRSIPNLLNYFDCIYMGTTDSNLYRFGLGLNKFFDALMAGKPVILSTNAKNTIIEENDCGIIVPAGDIEGIKNAILEVKSYSKDKIKEIEVHGKEAAKNKYLYNVIAEKFENVMAIPGKKNILLINHYAGSPEMGMEFRPYYMAREWVKAGHRVDIIAADYSHLRISNPSIVEDFEESIIDEIHYHWIHTGKYDENGVKRAITMFQFVGKLLFSAKKIVKEFKPDVVITSSTYPLDNYVGQKIRKVSK